MNSREKFDTLEKPLKTPAYLKPVMWILALANVIPVGGKIKKVNCEGLEPPFLLLQNHGSFVDFAMAEKAIMPKSCNWVISIEEFNGREWLLRNIGGIYKRKFTKDITVVKHVLTSLRERTCVIYPEARFSLAGVNERLDGALGKLVKKAKVPVVTFIQNGNFLRSPQWNKSPKRKVRVEGTFTQIVTREELADIAPEEIDRRINEKFVYDEYQWQFDNKIEINSKYRAHNIHKILYQCPCCKKEFTMDSKHTKLWCTNCGASWEMDSYGVLRNEKDSKLDKMVPEWYRWERGNVKQEVADGEYHFEDEVRIEEIKSSHDGFVEIGSGKITQDENGFLLKGTLLNGEDFELHRSVASMYSCHIEYNYKGRGDALELCTLSDTYFVYPKTFNNVLTKLHFATEELYDKLYGKSEK